MDRSDQIEQRHQLAPSDEHDHYSTALLNAACLNAGHIQDGVKRSLRTLTAITAGVGQGMITDAVDRLQHKPLQLGGELALASISGIAFGALAVAAPEISVPLGVGLMLAYAKQQIAPDDAATVIRNKNLSLAVSSVWNSAEAQSNSTRVIADNLGSAAFDFAACTIAGARGFGAGRSLCVKTFAVPSLTRWGSSYEAADGVAATRASEAALRIDPSSEIGKAPGCTGRISKNLTEIEPAAPLTENDLLYKLGLLRTAPKNIVRKNKAGDDFVNVIESSLSELPQPHLDKLEISGWKIHCHQDMEEVDSELADKRPRGYPEGTNYRNCRGYASPATKEIHLFEFVNDSNGNRVSTTTIGISDTVKHEVGHAFDFMNNWHCDKEIINFYNRARADALKDSDFSKQYKYFLQPEQYRPWEAHTLQPVPRQFKSTNALTQCAIVRSLQPPDSVVAYRPGLNETLAELYMIKYGGKRHNIDSDLFGRFGEITQHMENKDVGR